MIDWIQTFLLAFIPLFVAMDPLGLIPIYLGLTDGMSGETRNKTSSQATWTAVIVAIGFMFLGKSVFRVLGITVADFQVAGGLILLVLAVQDLLKGWEDKAHPTGEFGVVPLGLPLIVGPATLTVLLILMDSVGFWYTFIALIVNLAIVNLAMHYSGLLARWVGLTGLRASSKIISLLLAAIAVSMIRQGWQRL